MARKRRIEFPGAIYHVYTRGNNKQQIFIDEQDFFVYTKRIERYQKRYDFLCYVFMIMPNHIHLVLETAEVPLSKIMQGIQQSYTQYFHKKYGVVGHVFQGRYGAILCERNEYLLSLVSYIHLNPWRSKLVKFPEDYIWSSHRNYLGDDSVPFVDSGFILNLFSEREEIARKEYLRLIRSEMAKEEKHEPEDAKIQTFCGNQEFISEIKKKLDKPDQKELREKRVADDQETRLRKKSLADILKIVSEITTVSSERILSRSQERSTSEARSFFVFTAVRSVGHRNLDVARFIQRELCSVSRMIARIDEQKIHDRRIQKVLKMINHITTVSKA